MVDSLSVAASNFKPPQNPLLRYEVKVKYKPSVPDNVKSCKVFEDDEQIKWYIEVVEDFSNSTIDQGEEKDEYQQPTSW